MTVTRSLFRTTSNHESIPGKIISSINDSITEDNDSNMFVTFFVGVLDLPTGRLHYCNAGHNKPLMISDSEKKYINVDSNLPLGIVHGMKYTTQDITISPGTMLLLYTDGLTEAENEAHEQFEGSRMISHVKIAKPIDLVMQMSEAVSAFVGDAEQSDDITIMAIQYSRQKSEVKIKDNLILQNDIEEIPQLAEFIERVCEEAGVDMGLTMSINLALEEAVVNVMDYAYPKGIKGQISIDAEANDERMKFIITDQGKPFDPTAKGEVDTTLSLEERPTGGLGIHMVRNIMDSINYERMGNNNVLTLRKKLV